MADALELDDRSEPTVRDSQTRDLESSLERCDGGYAAWRLLFAAYLFEALLWGFPLSFGVFQNYYSQLPQFAANPYISVVGTSASGLSYLGAPIVIPLAKRFSKYQRQMIWVGWPICILGLLAGSFASSLGTLVFTQGIMYGVGFLICYYPVLAFVNEYWIARRGMAYGFLCSASGASGAVMPFVLGILLKKYGYSTTLRGVAIGLIVLTGPLLPILKGRLPPSNNVTTNRTDWSFFKSQLFWVYTVSNLAQGLGYFFPSVYLPSYATSIGLSAIQGALLIAVLSTSQVFGQFTFGYLSDHRMAVNSLMLLSTLVSAASVLALWGFAFTFVRLIFFSLIYGFFGAGYTAMWARMGTAVNSEPSTAFVTFGLFCLQKGVGNILTGPISAALIRQKVDDRMYGVVKYEGVVLFTGMCMLASAASILIGHIKPNNILRISSHR